MTLRSLGVLGVSLLRVLIFSLFRFFVLGGFALIFSLGRIVVLWGLAQVRALIILLCRALVISLCRMPLEEVLLAITRHDLVHSCGLFIVLSGYLFGVIGTIVAVYGRVAYSLVALIICVVMSLLCSLCVVVLFHIFGRRHAAHYIEIIHDSREWYLVMIITATQDITQHYLSHGFWGMGPLSVCTMILLQMYIATVYARLGVAIQLLSELRIGLLGLIGCHLLQLLIDLAFHRGRALVYYVICEVVFFTLLILDRALIEMKRWMIARGRRDAPLLPL